MLTASPTLIDSTNRRFTPARAATRESCVAVRRRLFGGVAATCHGVTGYGWTAVAALDDLARKLQTCVGDYE